MINIVTRILNWFKPTTSEAFPTTMELTSTNYSSTSRYVEFTLHNNYLLSGSLVVEAIYNSVFNLQEFKDMGKNKVIIVVGYDYDNTFNVHPNVFVTNKTTLKQYYKLTEHLINNRYDQAQRAVI